MEKPFVCISGDDFLGRFFNFKGIKPLYILTVGFLYTFMQNLKMEGSTVYGQ